MTTENGLEKLGQVRKDIEVLRSRKEWLLRLISDKNAAGRESKTGYDWAEVKALEWAIPVLEAEFDNLSRMQRNVRRLENRSHASPNIPKDAWLLEGEEPVPVE